MNEDLTFGVLGAAMGFAAPQLGDIAGWLSAIGSIGCLIGTAIGVTIRIIDAVRKYRQGKISAEEAQRRLNHLNEEDNDGHESD